MGIIFDIQRYSIHDGSGIRTLVFMKGCPLSCKWCCNPEGQRNYPEIKFVVSRCVGGGKCKAPCVKACPTGAISLFQGRPEMERGDCQGCGKCAEVCLYGARQLSGKSITIEKLMAEVLKDKLFYDFSGGGVTLGGGEPIMQFEFTNEFLKRCKEHSLHTAIETCGCIPWEHLRATLKFVDFVYYDTKHMDPIKHKELTGVSNDLILGNARRLLSTNSQVVVRVPIVSGYNDSEENIEAIARFVAESGGTMMELLPYHRFGVSKYSQLNRGYELEDVREPTEEHLQRLRRIVQDLGIKEVAGVI